MTDLLPSDLLPPGLASAHQRSLHTLLGHHRPHPRSISPPVGWESEPSAAVTEKGGEQTFDIFTEEVYVIQFRICLILYAHYPYFSVITPHLIRFLIVRLLQPVDILCERIERRITPCMHVGKLKEEGYKAASRQRF